MNEIQKLYKISVYTADGIKIKKKTKYFENYKEANQYYHDNIVGSSVQFDTYILKDDLLDFIQNKI